MGQLWTDGTLEVQATRRRGGVGSDCANWKTRAGHGVTVGIFVTRPDRLPRLRAPGENPPRLFVFLLAKRTGFSAHLASLSFDSRSDKSTYEASYLAVTTRGARVRATCCTSVNSVIFMYFMWVCDYVRKIITD